MNPKTPSERPVSRLLLGLAALLAALTPACIVVPTDDWETGETEEIEDVEDIDQPDLPEDPDQTEDPDLPEEPEMVSSPVGIVLGEELSVLPMVGGAGGDAYSDACAPGQVLVGLGGYFDDRGWHGMMAAGCAPLEFSEMDDGSFVVGVGEWTATPMHGSAGQQPWISECPENEMMVGFSGRAGLLLDKVQIACAAFEVVETTEGFALVAGEPHFLDAVGADGGAAFDPIMCESGSVATVVDMRAGESIDALGVSCRELALTF